MPLRLQSFDNLGRKTAFDEKIVPGIAPPSGTFDGFLDIGLEVDDIGNDLGKGLGLAVGPW